MRVCVHVYTLMAGKSSLMQALCARVYQNKRTCHLEGKLYYNDTDVIANPTALQLRRLAAYVSQVTGQPAISTGHCLFLLCESLVVETSPIEDR